MITFTRQRRDYDESTDISTVTETQITGEAIEVSADPDQYAQLGLSMQDYPTLFFTPTQYNLRSHTDEFVRPGDVAVFNGRTMVAKGVKPIAPDGFVIAARIVVAAA